MAKWYLPRRLFREETALLLQPYQVLQGSPAWGAEPHFKRAPCAPADDQPDQTADTVSLHPHQLNALTSLSPFHAFSHSHKHVQQMVGKKRKKSISRLCAKNLFLKEASTSL